MSARPSILAAGLLFSAAVGSAAYWVRAHRPPAVPTIALIPQAAGEMLWEVEHFGAMTAAEKLKCRLYWNTPTSESDVAGQVYLIDRVARGKYQGLVIAPNHSVAILTALRRALAAGLPVMVVSASLDLPANAKLGYIVNDDEKMGELAAAEMARLIHGQGSVALVGLARYAPGVTRRARAAERLLTERFPNIHVVVRVPAGNNARRAEQLTNSAVDAHPDLAGVLSFTAGSTRGVHAALKSRSLQKRVALIGCDQDSDLIGYVGSGEIAGILAENTYRMGYEAVGSIAASLGGKALPALSVVPPVLITKEKVDSGEASLFTSFPK